MALKKLYKNGSLTKDQIEVRELAMSSLRYFVALVAPHLHLGHAHHDLLDFLDKDVERKLVIWPRGHLKSTLLAYKAARTIIKEPDSTNVYLSATADLAEKQTTLIKTIIDSPIVKKYWPELLPEEEGRRDLWRTSEFNVGHWKRQEEVVRDPTLKAAGITGNITGFHADHLYLDDLVTADNSETKTSRDEINSRYSFLSSILNAGGTIDAVGTRYHPDDLYDKMINMKSEVYDEEGNVIEEISSYEVTQEVVEVDGQFLWPRSKRKDGKWFGFNFTELSKKKADYLDKAKFFSQYYNDPSDPGNKKIQNFNYYDKEKLVNKNGFWYFNGDRLNIYAAIDFAATITHRADYTAIAVVGIDKNGIIYVLDLSRFKTEKISKMAEELSRLYDKWSWIKLKAETNAQQNLVVEQIKEYNKQAGVYYTIDKQPSLREKQVRIMSILEPRYEAGVILHFRGGLCEILEQELTSTKPPHDDVSDALASVMEIVKKPSSSKGRGRVTNLKSHPRFGGII